MAAATFITIMKLRAGKKEMKETNWLEITIRVPLASASWSKNSTFTLLCSCSLLLPPSRAYVLGRAKCNCCLPFSLPFCPVLRSQLSPFFSTLFYSTLHSLLFHPPSYSCLYLRPLSSFFSLSRICQVQCELVSQLIQLGKNHSIFSSSVFVATTLRNWIEYKLTSKAKAKEKESETHAKMNAKKDNWGNWVTV